MKALEVLPKLAAPLKIANFTDLDAVVLSRLAGNEVIENLTDALPGLSLGAAISQIDDEFLSALSKTRYGSLHLDYTNSEGLRALSTVLADNTVVIAFSGANRDLESRLDELSLIYLSESPELKAATAFLEQQLERYADYDILIVGTGKGATLGIAALSQSTPSNVLGTRFFGKIPQWISEGVIDGRAFIAADPDWNMMDSFLAHDEDSVLTSLFHVENDALNWEFDDDGKLSVQ